MNALALAALLALPARGAVPSGIDDMEEASRDLRLRPDIDAVLRQIKERHRAAVPVSRAPYVLVDLHAHLWMEDGLGLLFTGGFDEPISAGSWKDRFSSTVNPATLGTSNLGIVVAALYAHPVFAPDRKGALRDQVAKARAFTSSHPEWILARTPSEARAAIGGGRRVIILSLEGAGGILETEDDLVEFIDKLGISIVTLAHMTDDELSGAAFMKGYRMPLGNPEGAADWLFNPTYGEGGVKRNPNGLTAKGRRLVKELLKRKVWIDLSHSPEEAVAEIAPMLAEAGQPALYTHIGLRRFYKAERELSSGEAKIVRDSGGIVGLIPSEEITGATLGKDDICRGGVFALAHQYNLLANVLGPERVFIGSDFNGAMQHLAPSNCATGTSLDGKRGFYHIGQTAELWYALRRAGANADSASFRGAYNFLDVWDRVRGAP